MSAMDLDSDLDAFLIGDDWPPDEPPPVPEDAVGASRLLLAVRGRERKLDEISSYAKERIDEISRWRDDRTHGLKKSIEFIERSLQTWMRSHHDKTQEITTNLPDGVLKLRPGSPSLQAHDEVAAVKWARENRPGWIRTTYAIVKDDAKKDLKVGPAIEDKKILEQLGEIPDTHEWRRVLVGDEVVPGLAMREPMSRVFGYETLKPKKPKQQKLSTTPEQEQS